MKIINNIIDLIPKDKVIDIESKRSNIEIQLTNKINYVIASWSGDRTVYRNDYLHKHLQHLSKLDHNLSQITIGHPFNKKESKGYLEECLSIKQSCTVVVMDQENIGISYGQYARAYNKFRTEFDWYIFIEDDYFPVIDNFDNELIDMYKEKKTDVLCSLDYTEKYKKHMAISNCIIHSNVLETIYTKHKGIPIFNNRNIYLIQIQFSNLFSSNNFVICDYLYRYRSLFYNSKKKEIEEYKNICPNDIIVPYHHVYK